MTEKSLKSYNSYQYLVYWNLKTICTALPHNCPPCFNQIDENCRSSYPEKVKFEKSVKSAITLSKFGVL